VLVVDPDREAGAKTSELLQGIGYAVEVARDGFEALSAMSRVTPAVLVVDQALSGSLDAAALVARARKLRDVKDVAVVSTAVEPNRGGIADRLRAANVTVFIDKPLYRGRLASAMRVALGQEQPVTEPAAPRPRVRSALRQRGPGGTEPSATSPPRPHTTVPSATSPTATGPHMSMSTGSMMSVAGLNEVDSWLEWDEKREHCVLERATTEWAIVRCACAFPPQGTAIRLTVPLRAVIQDAMRDVPVRILGELTAAKPLPGGARLKIVIKAARPDGNFRKLRNYLKRPRQ